MATNTCERVFYNGVLVSPDLTKSLEPALREIHINESTSSIVSYWCYDATSGATVPIYMSSSVTTAGATSAETIVAQANLKALDVWANRLIATYVPLYAAPAITTIN